MTRPGRHLVFDVGGTQLRAAVYDGESGALAGTARTEAPNFQRHPGVSWHELRSKLVDEMSALRAVLDPQGLVGSAAVAFPGPVDGEGRVLAAPPLWGSLGDYPYALGRDLGAAWGCAPVRVMNDVTAAGFRYMRSHGDDFCLVTISTGIGNKVFVGGRPLLGSSGRGGEIGHLQVDASPAAAPCDCGGRGHLAALASGRGMQRRARARAEAPDGGFRGSSLAATRTAGALTVEDLAEAYRGGDAWAAGLVQDGVEALGGVLAGIHLAVGVDRVILVGGVSFGLGRRFCEDVAAAIQSRCWRGAAGGDPAAVRVLLGEDDGRCALLGAGRAVHLGLFRPDAAVIPKELLAALRTIEIHTARLANEQLAGTYHSSFKGQGLAFREVRPYQPGDDVRTIDWNVSARMNDAFVKVFVEEREMTVMLVVDLSASEQFGTRRAPKTRVASEVAALLAFSAIRNGDRVGLIIATDRIERLVPPKKGEKHVMRVIREILGFQPGARPPADSPRVEAGRRPATKAAPAPPMRLGAATDLKAALEGLVRISRRRSIAFVLSDFFDTGYERALALAAAKHDVVPVVLVDHRDTELPDVGLASFEDLESGESVLVDTGDPRVRAFYADAMKRIGATRRAAFNRLGLDSVDIDTAGSFVRPLRDLFARRSRRIRR